MKFKRHLYNLYLFFLLLIIALSFYLFNQHIFSNKNSALSPLPSFLTFLTNNQVKPLDIWKPSEKNAKVLGISIEEPLISAKSALVYDLTTDSVLFIKGHKERLQ